MKKAEMKVYKERLILLRARLRGYVSTMANSTVSSGKVSADGLELDTSETELSFSMLATEGQSLGQIEDALERIEEGVYGACVECGGRIPKTRLNALPFTPYCVKCADNQQTAR